MTEQRKRCLPRGFDQDSTVTALLIPLVDLFLLRIDFQGPSRSRWYLHVYLCLYPSGLARVKTHTYDPAGSCMSVTRPARWF